MAEHGLQAKDAGGFASSWRAPEPKGLFVLGHGGHTVPSKFPEELDGFKWEAGCQERIIGRAGGFRIVGVWKFGSGIVIWRMGLGFHGGEVEGLVGKGNEVGVSIKQAVIFVATVFKQSQYRAD